MDSIYWQVELHYILEITPPEACMYGTVDGWWPQNNPQRGLAAHGPKWKFFHPLTKTHQGQKTCQGQKINQTCQGYQTHQTLHTDPPGSQNPPGAKRPIRATRPEHTFVMKHHKKNNSNPSTPKSVTTAPRFGTWGPIADDEHCDHDSWWPDHIFVIKHHKKQQ